MVELLQKLWKLVPTMIIALIISLVIWISSITSQDPVTEKAYMLPVPIELTGQDPNLKLMTTLPATVGVTIKAPQSVWNQGLNLTGAVRAVVDVSGIPSGEHTLPVQVQVMPQPATLISQTPTEITLQFERLVVSELPVTVVLRGRQTEGYKAGIPQLNKSTVSLTGTESDMALVAALRAVVDIGNATESIRRTVPLAAVDANDMVIPDITILPSQVEVMIPISEQYGYRNVAISVPINTQVAEGYRLTGLDVRPLSVRIYSTDPNAVSSMPGFIETEPLNLTDADQNVEAILRLILPENIMVVGDQTTVRVKATVAPIEGSVTLTDVPLTVTGLVQGLQAMLAPDQITVIVTGPLSILDQLQASAVEAQVNLTDLQIGTHQVKPTVNLLIDNATVNTILPESVEVNITRFGATPVVPTPGG